MFARLVTRFASFSALLAFAVLAVPAIGTAQITEIIDITGEGVGIGAYSPDGVAVDGVGNVYVNPNVAELRSPLALAH